MNISKFFIARPVATSVFMLALFIFGCFAYSFLPISELPNVDFPTIVVTADLPGADPETMATTVATPIEKQLSTIAGIDSMSSVSSAGETRITLQFVLNRNIDGAAQDVQSALMAVSRMLPPQMPNAPTLRKVNPADSPILYLALTNAHSTLTKLDDYAENYLSPQLSMIPGVADVNVFGAQQYAVRIHLNPYALASRGLTLDSVTTAVQNLNSNQPTGTLQTQGHYHLIKVDGQLNNAQEFSDATLSSVNGAAIRLKDIGLVENSVANDKTATWYNDQRSIVLAIQRQPGENTVAVVQSIFKILPKLNAQLPGGAKLNIVYNRAQFIKHSIKDVQWTLIFAALLVVGVIFLFLRNFSLTVIAFLSLPLSVVATFGVMYLLNYSLDNLSLMALVLAVGFVIDDAIVVIENIMRHFESGLDKLSASIKGSGEIFFTVISMTLSLVAVFIPIFFMGGIIGRLFNEFAAVVGIAILLSGLVALTLIPMLCSRFIARSKEPIKPSRFETVFVTCRSYYEQSLRWSLSRQKIVLGLALALLITTGFLFYVVPKGFIPSQDTGILYGAVKAPEGITFEDFRAEQYAAQKIIQANPNVTTVVSSVGQGSGGVVGTNMGRFIIHLKPTEQRKLNADQVIQQLRQQLTSVAGLKISLTNPPAIQIGGKSTNSAYQYALQSIDWDSLKKGAALMQKKMAHIPGVQDVDTDTDLNNPELHLTILRDKSAALGITPAQIESTLYSAFGQRQISSILTSNGSYNVIIDIDPRYQQDINALNPLTVRSASGAVIPLTSLVKIEETSAPISIGHVGQLPGITLSFNLRPGVSLGAVTEQIQALAQQFLPDTVTGSFTGTAQTFQSSLATLPLLLLFTVLVIYMVLAILYEHYGHPLTILTALPFAAFGALFALILFNQELNLFSFIGLIMLVGLTKKNGIMMVDYALEVQRTQNLSSHEAIVQACIIRFRPIMMTTVAAIVATLPIALGMGAGGEARQALGVAVVGGLIFSQLITLYITPAFFLLMEKFSRFRFVKISRPSKSLPEKSSVSSRSDECV